jgi:hypothetical protein
MKVASLALCALPLQAPKAEVFYHVTHESERGHGRQLMGLLMRDEKTKDIVSTILADSRTTSVWRAS